MRQQVGRSEWDETFHRDGWFRRGALDRTDWGRRSAMRVTPDTIGLQQLESVTECKRFEAMDDVGL